MTLKFSILFLCAIGMVSAQSGYSRDSPSNQLQYQSHSNQEYNNAEEDNEVHGDEIPGEAGTDYPIYDTVPDTGFSCDNQQFPGYYADPQSQCQAFYICQKGGHSDSLLCPNGTIFNQDVLVCDWWYNVDCSKSEELYAKNELIVKAMEEADARLEQQKSAGYNEYPSHNGNGNNHAAQTNGNGIKPVYGAPSNDLTDAQYINGNGKNGIKPVYGVPSNGPSRIETLSNGNGHNGNGQNGNGHNGQNGNGHNGNGRNGNGHNGNGRNGNGNHAVRPVYGPPASNTVNPSNTYLPPNGNGLNGNGNGHKNGNGNGHNNGNGNGHNTNGNGNGHNTNGNGNGNGHNNGNGKAAPNGFANGNTNSIEPQGPIDESVDVFQPFNTAVEGAPSRTYLPPV